MLEKFAVILFYEMGMIVNNNNKILSAHFEYHNFIVCLKKVRNGSKIYAVHALLKGLIIL